MLDIKLVRANPELVKENIKKKFQDEKLVLVDEVLELDKQFRDAKSRGDYLRSQRNTLSKQIGGLMAKGQKEQAEEVKAQVTAMAQELADLEVKEEQLTEEIKKRMMVIPNIIDESFRLARTTAKMWKWSALASRSFLRLRFLTMWTLWSACTASTWTAQEEPAVPVSTTCAAILQDCTRQSCPMQGTL